jgi:hypothetical protein
VGFADDGVFRDVEPPADFGGGKSFGPEGAEFSDNVF